eukprot:CAMPEP_0171066718 /NCGR_PEP_ID=MMETSP0766_2-20121228/7584_1 /TAXON_ID=439317 /ORGANISM="Gambierdiscus australes, Strain CAWD 149" /LENGTH=246 /DNA_ID=CAMNT_0011522907 /DNA_START=144 /DNA_END=884 /DNA_ORIENTATION=+
MQQESSGLWPQARLLCTASVNAEPIVLRGGGLSNESQVGGSDTECSSAGGLRAGPATEPSASTAVETSSTVTSPISTPSTSACAPRLFTLVAPRDEYLQQCPLELADRPMLGQLEDEHRMLRSAVARVQQRNAELAANRQVLEAKCRVLERMNEQAASRGLCVVQRRDCGGSGGAAGQGDGARASSTSTESAAAPAASQATAEAQARSALLIATDEVERRLEGVLSRRGNLLRSPADWAPAHDGDA